MNKLEQIIATCFSGLNYLLYAKWLWWQVHCQQNTLSCSMFAVHVCFIIKSSLRRIVFFFTCFLSYSCNQFSNSLLTQTWIRTDDLFIVVTAVSAFQIWKVFSTIWPCYISMNRQSYAFTFHWGKAKVLRFPRSSTNHIDNCRINPLQPNISMHILFTVLCTLPQVMRSIF